MPSDFSLLWAGQGVSQLGDAVTLLALPLTAVVVLHASTFEVGALESAGAAAWLLLSLFAGAWADRLRRRPLLLGADLARAALLASVPVAYALGGLTLAQLYGVAFCSAAATVLFTAAYTAYLPSLVPSERLPTANARLQSTAEGSYVAGAPLGGTLVSLLSGPGALLVDAVSFVVAAASTLLIRHREDPRPRVESRLRGEIAEGLRVTLGEPSLRALSLFSGLANLLFSALGAVTIVLLARGLHFSSALVGLCFMFGGLGGLLGGVLSSRVISWVGLNRSLWLPGLLTLPFALLQPLVGPGPRVVPYAVGAVLLDVGVVIYNVSVASCLQTRVPQQLLGRTSSVIRLVSRGAIVAGGLLAGLLAWWLGLRGSMWALTAGIAVLPVLQAFSPLRRFGEVELSAVG
jgi:predicted MFS family arabinose efflux permease